MTDTTQHLMKSLEQIKLEDDDETADKFNSLQNKSEIENDHLSPSVVKEDITVIKGIGAIASENLYKAGIMTIRQLADMTVDELSHIQGIGVTTAEKIIQGAKSHYSTTSLDTFSPDNSSGTSSNASQEESFEEVGDYSEFEEEDEILDNNFQESEIPTQVEEQKILDIKPKSIIKKELVEEHFELINERRPKVNGPIFEEENDDIEYNKPPGLDDIEMQKVDLRYEETPQQDEVTTDGEIRSLTKFSADQVKQKVKELSPNLESKHNLSHSEKQDLLRKISKTLKNEGFYIIDKKSEFQEIYHGIGLVVVKLIKVKNNLQIIYIIPIKVCNIDGSLLVSSTRIGYKSISQKFPAIERRLNSYPVVLTNSCNSISENLKNQDNFYSYLDQYLQLELDNGNPVNSNFLNFSSGPLQYKVIITPFLVSHSDVKFTGKILPFAYQKASNLYVVSIKNLSDLLQYSEKKYYSIETYNKKHNSLSANKKKTSAIYRRVCYISVPFIVVGVLGIIFLLTGFLQEFSTIAMFTNLEAGLLGLYGIIIGYFYIFNNRRKSKQRQEFSTPYHKRKLIFEETNLMLIREELGTNLMEQFAYDCVDENNDSEIIANVEKNNAQNRFTRKNTKKRIENANLFETKDESKSVVEKYSSFLED